MLGSVTHVKVPMEEGMDDKLGGKTQPQAATFTKNFPMVRHPPLRTSIGKQ